MTEMSFNERVQRIMGASGGVSDVGNDDGSIKKLLADVLDRLGRIETLIRRNGS